eukprot:TRINITY_DN6394_c0_g1_i1.p1 TRINITY_DN6394_c0_g1~~TRINITY_DN6394_c0_g1_i1.p1  ORF type:complete len:245 (-),score=60.86 TRINITY_DN6394_c0_g1_i1:40-774(-)
MDDRATVEAAEKLIRKRLDNYLYIKRVHQGTVHWMNTVLITQEDIRTFYSGVNPSKSFRGPSSAATSGVAAPNPKDRIKKRVEQWFYIGISLAPLLEVDGGDSYVGAVATFWSEFELWKSKGPKKVLAARKDFQVPSGGRTLTGSGGHEFLNTPNIPCVALDYFEVVFTLCDLMEHIYKKFLKPTLTPAVAKNVLKVDSRFKHHILGKISGDLNKLALGMLKQQIGAVDKNLSHSWEDTEDNAP